MKVWYKKKKIMCLSEQCTEACPRFNKCITIMIHDEEHIKLMIDQYQYEQ